MLIKSLFTPLRPWVSPSAILALMVLFIGLSGHSSSAFGDGGITITPEALLKTGQQDPSTWILPNGRVITPPGVEVAVDNLPLGLAVSPDGAYLFVAASGRGLRTVSVVDVAQARVVDTVEHDALFLGVAVSPDGRTVYASGGGGEAVHVYDFEGGDLELRTSWEVKGFPAGIALSSDGGVLFTVCQLRRRLRAIETGTGEILDSAPTGPDPYGVALHPGGAKAYVSSERHDRVDVYDISDPGEMRLVKAIPVQKNPEGLAVSEDGSNLYVTNADEDSVSVVCTTTDSVLAIIDLRPHLDASYGSSPNALAFSPDGTRLYVAQAADNKISVIAIPEGELMGAIPTAWYPTAVAVSPDGSTLFVANAKGNGSGPSGDAARLDNTSTVLIAPVPTDTELIALTEGVEENNSLPGRLFEVDEATFDNPVPLEPEGPTPIKHVLIVVRENKTYDALLGDWPHGDGEPENCAYCDETTPNLRALVERFASGDNYYSNAEASIQGHMLVTSSTVNTYVEKLWKANKRIRPMEYDVFINPVAWPKMGFIFQNALRHGVSFRDYGEAVGMGPGLLIFDPEYMHSSLIDPPFYYPLSHDAAKIEERIAEWESGIFPSLIFMLFPNDHTMGCVFPFPTPRSMIADNDFATGRLIDWLSHSSYWEESVVFVIEDDPQGGRDHVDAHRSVLLVASPWVKRRYVSPVHYSEAHLHSTVQHILGMEPMTIFDECAQPMWDLFTTEPDLEPFQVLPREYPQEMSIPGITCAKASKGLDFVDPDEAEGLQEILWAHEMEVRASREVVKGRRTVGTEASRQEGEGVRKVSISKPDLSSPIGAFLSLKRAAGSGDVEAARSIYTRESRKLLKEYRRLVSALGPTVLPADASDALLAVLRDSEPRVISESVKGGEATLRIVYSNNMEAELRFVQQSRRWKLDLAGEIEDSVRIMGAFKKKFEAFENAGK